MGQPITRRVAQLCVSTYIRILIMYYNIIHTTSYIYAEPISLCHNIALLVPRNTQRQQLKKTSVSINPEPDVFNEYEDFFGNKAMYFAVQHEHKKLTVTVTSRVEKIYPPALEIGLFNNITIEEAKRQLYETNSEYIEARQYIPETAMTAIDSNITAFAQQSFTQGRPVFEAVKNLMYRIFSEFRFTPGFTTVTTPVSTVMQQRKGVCQDFAHLAIACIRAMGLPARYVSGYIETIPPNGKAKLVGVDASHAWFAVFIPGMGWHDFDPTNNQIPGDQHITVGWGRDYADITPLKGVILSSGPHRLSVSVDVRRVF